MASPELEKTIQAQLYALGFDAATIEQRPDSTIVPKSKGLATAGSEALELLRDLGAATTISKKIELHGIIAEGGMGIVRLGTQRTLLRQVAVKTLKPDVRSERATVELLREAWITGSLEHPNIVPIYDVALEADGSPLIILKRIEGTGWDALIADPVTVRKRFGTDDPLEWNLRILMQLCNAVHFAHSRGVLHRDLKPENVMIGEFGEVYLVDWGIAVRLEDDGTGRLPLAKDALELAGTPLYMAPEMLGGRESRLSERTDVYLLGAILYEIAVGRPPHRGDALMEIVHHIIESNPEIPDTVPDVLGKVIRRAMDADPHGRFETAEQVRLALAGFLEHRTAAALAALADARRAQLVERLRKGAIEDDDREAIYHLFGESRFGYRHALEIWPQSEEARDGLRRAIEAMVEFELSEGEPEAARTLLAELPSVPEELAARVEAARKKRSEEDAALRKLRDEHDPQAGRRTRAFLAIILGSSWSISPLLVEGAMRLGWLTTPSHLIPICSGGFFLLVALGLGTWARESMTRTRINRIIGMSGILGMLTPIILHSTAYLSGGTEVLVTTGYGFAVWAALIGMVAVAVDWRLLVPAVGYVIGFTVLAFWPRGVFITMSVCNEILLVTMVFAWFRTEDLRDLRELSKRRRAERHAWMRKRLGHGPKSESTG